MEILPWNPLYVYIANLVAMRVVLRNFTTVAYNSNALACIIHARDDETHMLKDVDSFHIQYDKLNSDSIINHVRNYPIESRNKQVDRHKAVI